LFFFQRKASSSFISSRQEFVVLSQVSTAVVEELPVAEGLSEGAALPLEASVVVVEELPEKVTVVANADVENVLEVLEMPEGVSVAEGLSEGAALPLPLEVPIAEVTELPEKVTVVANADVEKVLEVLKRPVGGCVSITSSLLSSSTDIKGVGPSVSKTDVIEVL
jgi:hypothetical protein